MPKRAAEESPDDKRPKAAPAPVPAVLSKEEFLRSLGIPTQAKDLPEPPLRPTPAQIALGEGGTVRDYMVKLVPVARTWVTYHLAESGFLGKPALRVPLHSLPALGIGKTAAGGQSLNFREPLSVENCVSALGFSGLYEASTNALCFDALTAQWQGKALAGIHCGWQQLCNAEVFWTEEALEASGADARKQRFIFEGFLPTVVEDVGQVTSGTLFVNMPLVAGRLFGSNSLASTKRPNQPPSASMPSFLVDCVCGGVRVDHLLVFLITMVFLITNGIWACAWLGAVCARRRRGARPPVPDGESVDDRKFQNLMRASKRELEGLLEEEGFQIDSSRLTKHFMAQVLVRTAAGRGEGVSKRTPSKLK